MKPRTEEKLGRREEGRRGGVREGWRGGMGGVEWLDRHGSRHREGKSAEMCKCVLSSAPASSKLL